MDLAFIIILILSLIGYQAALGDLTPYMIGAIVAIRLVSVLCIGITYIKKREQCIKNKNSIWFYFLGCLISPELACSVFILLMPNDKQQQPWKSSILSRPSTLPQAALDPQITNAQQKLNKLENLKANGLIDEQDYNRIKQDILNNEF